jgi:integrase
VSTDSHQVGLENNMACKRKRKSGNWEFIVKNNKVLAKPLYLTFDTEKEGDVYCAQLEALLNKGYIPQEFRKTYGITRIRDLIREYCSSAEMTESDRKLLNVMVERLGGQNVDDINIVWAESWVDSMKIKYNLAPSTIRHHVGALARCFDWGMSREVFGLESNPLRKLGNKYSFYGKRDMAVIDATPGLRYRANTSRRRRFNAGEEDKVRKVLNREVLVPGQSILKLPYQTALVLMFDMATETAMRMREIFTLEVGQVDLKLKTIHLYKTKNGDTREVPMSSVIIKKVEKYIEAISLGDPTMEDFDFDGGRLFPWWNGSHKSQDLNRVTVNLSKQFARVFQKAEVGDFHFHDIRHEATSRLFEKTDLDSVEIAKITGHKDPRMLMVYTNLRGSNLAEKLW